MQKKQTRYLQDDSEKDEKLGRAKKPSKKKTELWTKRN